VDASVDVNPAGVGEFVFWEREVRGVHVVNQLDDGRFTLACNECSPELPALALPRPGSKGRPMNGPLSAKLPRQCERLGFQEGASTGVCHFCAGEDRD
jgi:hypothetical protein